MSVQVEGQGFEVGESLSAHVKEAMSKIAKKYGIDIIASNIVFSPSPHKKAACSILIQVPRGDIFAKKEAEKAQSAFSAALAEAERQLLKRKKEKGEKPWQV